MKKNKQAPALSRWWRYKYSGLITFAPIIIVAIILAVVIDTEQEFYSAWSCQTIEKYMLGDEVPEEFPLHNDLTENQHLKLHKIYAECVESEKYITPHD